MLMLFFYINIYICSSEFVCVNKVKEKKTKIIKVSPNDPKIMKINVYGTLRTYDIV